MGENYQELMRARFENEVVKGKVMAALRTLDMARPEEQTFDTQYNRFWALFRTTIQTFINVQMIMTIKVPVLVPTVNPFEFRALQRRMVRRVEEMGPKGIDAAAAEFQKSFGRYEKFEYARSALNRLYGIAYTGFFAYTVYLLLKKCYEGPGPLKIPTGIVKEFTSKFIAAMFEQMHGRPPNEQELRILDDMAEVNAAKIAESYSKHLTPPQRRRLAGLRRPPRRGPRGPPAPAAP